MTTRQRTINIPLGGVAQRIQAFQDDRKGLTASPRTTPWPPTSNTFGPILPAPKPPTAETGEPASATTPASHENKIFLEPRPDEAGERGQALHRPRETGIQDTAEDPFDEALKDVRSRLYSVQEIVRRERSGGSQARDEMMDELGGMIDGAIATTLTPLPTPHVPTGSSSSRRSSPAKQHLSRSARSGSQLLKIHHLGSDEPKLTKSPLPTSSDGHSGKEKDGARKYASPRHLFSNGLAISCQRQSSEPVAFTNRENGFPLLRPVRERALLWESMSRGTITEQETSCMQQSATNTMRNRDPAWPSRQPEICYLPPGEASLAKVPNPKQKPNKKLLCLCVGCHSQGR